ncbi:MAG: CBS domain-containing protein [Desulfuromonas sp.]|nr:CBS domain-containing protein [Desulfuromonas sp.]
MLKAKDIMTVDVHTVTAATELKKLAALLEQTGYSTLPVVDDTDQLVGVISATDLIDRDKPLHIPTVVSLFDWVLYLESEKNFEEQVMRISAQTVDEICTKPAISCTPECPVSEIADLMVKNKIHLVPVVEDQKLVGVVARLDIIRVMGA